MSKITLYHASWCDHCVTFKPTWDKLTKQLDKLDIIHEEYEETNLKDKNKIKEAKITGFPTIKITKNDNTYDYEGERDIVSIIAELKEGMANSKKVSKKLSKKVSKKITKQNKKLKGGCPCSDDKKLKGECACGKDKDYKHLYLKYKSKYLNLFK
jgi:glutaredoxin